MGPITARSAPGPLVLSGFALGSLAAALACSGGPMIRSAPEVRGPDGPCITCHVEEGAQALESGFHRGDQGGPGCTLCHEPHEDGAGLGPAALRSRCEDCHAEVLADFRMPFRHPIDPLEGCVACHPAHGGSRRELSEHLRHEACVDCHFELRGPVLFEHEGDRNLLCLSCHLPHGSPNRRLLTHADNRSLCMSCHETLEQIHVQNPGSIFRDCVLCHTEVHGSNWDRALFR